MGNTELEKAVKGVMDTFHTHSIQRKDSDELDLQELSSTIKEEYPTFLSICGKGNPDGYIKHLFEENKGQDGQVNFNNYMKIVGKMTNTYHNLSHNHRTCGDRS